MTIESCSYLMKQKLSILTVAPLLFSISSAELVITEVMSKSSHPADKDWWELSNTDNEAVNVEGYYWDDDGESGDDGAILPDITIGPGESIIIIEGEKSDFEGMWAPTGLQLFDEDDVTGPDLFSGLSSGGETLSLWDKDPNNHDDAVLIDSVTFPAANPGISFEWNSAGTPLGLSAEGQNNAFIARSNGEGEAGTDIGSPGEYVEAGSLVSPSFQPPLVATWRKGLPLENSAFRVVASDPNAGEIISISIANQPAWLTLTDKGNGTAKLGGTPPEKGVFTFQVRIEDDSEVTNPVTETFTLHVFGDNNVVLMNEYNAVAAEEFIDGDDGEGVDTFFDREEGNGGDWFELAVVGTGNTANSPVTPQAGTTVDMRGWSVQITTSLIPKTIKLSQDDYWAAVPAGTILTFTERSRADGGYDTAINQTSKLDTEGYLWTNIQLNDPFFIDQNQSNFGDEIEINSSNTQFIVFDASGKAVFGPSGEGVLSTDTDNDGFPDVSPSVNAREVYKLEQDPSPAIDAMFAAYDDGKSSSFGEPNVGSAGAFVQDFTPYVTSNTPPSFTSLPILSPDEENYSYTITLSEAATIKAETMPEFLTLSGNVISNNRPITFDDVGTYAIELLADDGEATFNQTPQKFTLTVGSPFEQWLAGFGISPENANPDNDSATSLEEYLFGGDPTSSASFPILSISDGRFIIDLRRGVEDYLIDIEWSSDLENWSTELINREDRSDSPLGEEYRRNAYSYNGDSALVRFFRAKVRVAE